MKVDDIFNPRGGTLQVAVRTLLGIHSTTFISKISVENTITRVFRLDAPHLFLDFLHADFSAENGSDSQIPSLSRVGSSHHVLCVKHLLSQLRDTQSAERVTSTRCKGSESHHEKVQTGEGNHVDGEFSEIRVELARETETGGHAGHDG